MQSSNDDHHDDEEPVPQKLSKETFAFCRSGAINSLSKKHKVKTTGVEEITVCTTFLSAADTDIQICTD